MKRSGILISVWLLSVAASAAYSRSISYDGKTPVTSGTGTSVTLTGTTAASGCSGVLVENIDSLGCLPGISSLTFAPGDTFGSNSYTAINSFDNYTAFVWPPSAATPFNSSFTGAFPLTDFVAAVITGAGSGACAASTNANCWSLEFDYESVSETQIPNSSLFQLNVTPLTSCPSSAGAASVSIVSGGVTSTYTSSNPCAISKTELDFVGGNLTGTFCTGGGSCGTPTTGGATGVAPEIDPTSAMTALTLLAGCLTVFCGAGRRRPRQRSVPAN